MRIRLRREVSELKQEMRVHLLLQAFILHQRFFFFKALRFGLQLQKLFFFSFA
jgi:hypothetical protein